MSTRFDIVGPSEEIPLTFEFAPGLVDPETLTGDPVVVVEVDFGTDANAQNIVAGAQVMDDDTVIVAVRGMVVDVDYHITVTCTTSNLDKTLTVAGVLPVRRA